MIPPKKKIDPTVKKNFQDDLANSMNTQMKYVLPFIVAIGAYQGGAAIGIYWVASTVFTIVQEIVVKRQLVRQGVIKE
jgi:membrane protein insertase Oxa1/YidC/SpoIIIJ